MSMRLNAKQQQAFDLIVARRQNVFLTGAGGCGKTHTLKAICDALDAKHIAYAVTASTGAAAILINGVTVHRWSGCGVFSGSAEYLAKQIIENPRKQSHLYRAKNNWTTTQVLIIDEISMIDADTLEKLEYVARAVRRDQRPFGGMQLVLCGDFAQLPPVKPVGGMAFQSKLWATLVPNTVELTEVMRQADGAFRRALDEIRMGVVSDDTMKLLRSRVGAKVGNELIKPTIIFSKRIDVAETNRKELDKIMMPPVPFKAHDNFYPYQPKAEHREKLIEQCNKDMQPRQMMDLKVGAQVMLIVNLSNTLVNGSRGVVLSFENGLPHVQFINGEALTLDRNKWKVKVADKLWMERSQIPLILAWAATTHKSQGATLDCAEVEISNAFDYGQAYVALSRVRSLDGLSIKANDLSGIKAHPLVKDFYQGIRNRDDTSRQRLQTTTRLPTASTTTHRHRLAIPKITPKTEKPNVKKRPRDNEEGGEK